MNYIWGLLSAAIIYFLLSYFFPASETLIPETIHDDDQILDGVDYSDDGDMKSPRKEHPEVTIESKPYTREVGEV